LPFSSFLSLSLCWMFGTGGSALRNNNSKEKEKEPEKNEIA
jgi:hypothetical protein